MKGAAGIGRKREWWLLRGQGPKTGPFALQEVLERLGESLEIEDLQIRKEGGPNWCHLAVALDIHPELRFGGLGAVLDQGLREDRWNRLLRDVPFRHGRKYLDPCELFEVVGSGGMGVVYRAHHGNLDVEVAVKCLERSPTSSSHQAVERFRREASAAALINHPNVVRVFDVQHRHGVDYIIMEFVRGESCRELVARQGALPEKEAIEITAWAATGLGVAHAKGLVHRDVKPDNILRAESGEVKVVDLGLVNPGQEAPTSVKELGNSPANLTMSHAGMGTPLYMAPEQWKHAREVGPPADVWALGATLAFLLTGSDPHHEGQPCGLSHAAFPDVRSMRGDLSSGLRSVLARATDAKPSKRFANGTELAEALTQL